MINVIPLIIILTVIIIKIVIIITTIIIIIIITGVLSESDRCDLRLEPRLEHSGGENFRAAGAASSLPVKLLLASGEELCVRGVIVSRGRGSLPLGGEHSSLLGDFAAS